MPQRPAEIDPQVVLRRVTVLDMASAGVSMREIATKVGVSIETVRLDIEAELAAIQPFKRRKAEVLADLMERRLERYLLYLEPRLRKGVPSAVLAAVKVNDRLAKLRGLDKPTKVSVTDPDGGASPPQILISSIPTDLLERLFHETKALDVVTQQPGDEIDEITVEAVVSELAQPTPAPVMPETD